MSNKRVCRLCKETRQISRHGGGVCASCRYFSQAAMPGEWVHQAVCAQTDPEVFWPESSDPKAIKRAQQICMGCPVIADCLGYAIETNQTQGIWGGLTPAARMAWAEMLEVS